MKIGFLTYENFHGTKDVGSSRIRAKWLAKHWPEAEVADNVTRYDVLILQKVYYIEKIELYRKFNPNVKIILDLCDPDFYEWHARIKQTIDLCDAVTTSSVALAKFIVQLTDKPVWCIPDRLDMEIFGKIPKKAHKGDAKVAAWFGYSQNYKMLDTAINSLIKYKFRDLIVVGSAKMPYQLPAAAQGKINLINYPWREDTVYKDLLEADLVLNPQSKIGNWKYKSNNKTVTAWALGLPVAHNDQELKALISEEARKAEAEKRLAEVVESYDVLKSVDEYKALISQL